MWHHYLLGSKFIVRTDQHSLKFLLEKCIINTDYQKWVKILLGFDYDIQFRPSPKNKVVDALSQMPTTIVTTLFALSVPYVVDLREIDPQVTQHPCLCNIISDLLVAPDSHLGFSLLHGLLFYKTYASPSFCSPLIPLLL